MSSDNFDNTYRLGDAIVFVLKHKPFIDLSTPPTANDYQDATCVTLGIFNADLREKLVEGTEMVRVPNRPGWYFYRYQTTINMKPGLYTAILTAITTIDGVSYSTRNVKEFRLLTDGVA